MNGILAIKRKGEIKSLSDLQRIGDSAILKKNLFDLVDIVNRFCLGNKDIQKGSTYLVIPIDDTDCQIQKAHDVMEDIRRYLTIPNVLILMATDGDMLRNDFAQHYASEFKTGIDRGILESIDVEHYAEKYLTKLIPGTHRVYLPVFENILAGVREMTGWSRKKGSFICAIGMFLISLTTALGYSVLHFQPFAEGSAWLDFWDFIVSTNLLPIGALIFALFCCSDRFGWGWDNFIAEANAGKGMKVKGWMKPIFKYVVPIAVAVIYIIGLTSFQWK